MKNIFFAISFLVLGIYSCSAQVDYKRLFDQEIERTHQQRLQEAKEGNPYYFMILGYYINANNVMYRKTKEVGYLENNVAIINAIVKAGKPASKGIKGNIWIATFRDKVRYASVDNKEVPLYEGYGFRYIAEFYYMVKTNNITLPNSLLTLEFISDNFDKWIIRSKQNYNDYSMLHRERLHMGAQWASVALYLNKLTGKPEYKGIYDEYNRELRKDLREVGGSGNPYLIWNSTYRQNFTKSLVRSSPKSRVQDVTHGNHIVQFAVDSYELQEGGWTEDDLKLLANTVKYSIWDSSTHSFADNVDGSRNSDSALRGTGWKQSDGWMQLIEFDSSLKAIYQKFYLSDRSKIDKHGSVCLQFYANML